jgi:RNA polymerase sigma-70 factor (ECF subfamily)
MDETKVSKILAQIGEGDSEAVEMLLPIVYAELKKLAGGHLKRERKNHTLQATALVHEVYLKMADQDRTQWKNRAHFLAVASQAMRRILVDYARGRVAQKRGGDVPDIPLDEAIILQAAPANMDLLALDQSLTRLEKIQPEKAAVVEMRFFGGLKEAEIAEVLGVTPRTVIRYWKYAQAWLYRDLRVDLPEK